MHLVGYLSEECRQSSVLGISRFQILIRGKPKLPQFFRIFFSGLPDEIWHIATVSANRLLTPSNLLFTDRPIVRRHISTVPDRKIK